MMENAFNKPPVTEAFDYKSDLEKHFERKDFFNEDFSREDLHKLFALLIDYDNNLEKVFASKTKFDLLKEFNSKTKKIIYLLRDYIKDNYDPLGLSKTGKVYSEYEMIGKNDSKIESSLSLLKNYQNAILDYSRDNEYDRFMKSIDKSFDIELDELEKVGKEKDVKESKDLVLKEKLNLYKNWKNFEKKSYNIKGINDSLKAVDGAEDFLEKRKAKKEADERFQENKDSFYDKDSSKLRKSLYYDELRAYWLDGKNPKKDTIKDKKRKKDRFDGIDFNSFVRSIDVQYPVKVLAFTVNYEKVHISKIKEQFFLNDKFLNQKENADKKLKLEKLINEIKDSFSGEWDVLQAEMRESERTGDHQLENIDVAAFLAKWFNNKRPYGKLLDLSHVLRKENYLAKQENKRMKNAGKFNDLYERIEQIIKKDPLEENLSKFKTPEKLGKEMKKQVTSIKTRVAEDEEADLAVEASVENIEKPKTIKEFREKIKLTRKIEAYLIARAELLGNKKTVEEQINESDDFIFLEKLYNVSQGN